MDRDYAQGFFDSLVDMASFTFLIPTRLREQKEFDRTFHDQIRVRECENPKRACRYALGSLRGADVGNALSLISTLFVFYNQAHGSPFLFESMLASNLLSAVYEVVRRD